MIDVGDDDEDIDEPEPAIGTCQGCGRYGVAGEFCYRTINGRPEECGEYL